jgi:Na+-driven multidrug efflux pump
MQLANGATLILANHLVGIYGGADGIAVLGIASGLFTLMLMPIIGIRQGVQPIIGYNYGASAFGRVRATVAISLTATAAICGAVYLVFFVFSRAILELFVKDAPSIITLGVPSLRIFLASIPVVGIAVVGSVYFQSVKKSGVALLVTLVRQVIVLVPLYVVLPFWFGLTGVWLAGPLSDLVAALLTAALLVPEMQRLARMTLKSPEMNVHTPSLTSANAV